MEIADQQTPADGGGFALFSYGFRPFFLLAGVCAALLVPAWLCILMQGFVPIPGIAPHFWHGHEMIYGFAAAAIAGFLLTAVPSWTGARGFAGMPLIALVVLWLAGRAAMAFAGFLPLWLSGAIELAFLPALAVLLAPPLLRAGNRNTPMLLVLCALWIADAMFVAATHSSDAALAQRALRLAIDIVLVLVTVIGGRIVPAFTANALRRRGDTVEIVTRAWLERLVIGSMLAIVVVDVAWPDSAAGGMLAATAAAAHVLRLSGWRTLRTVREPILWVLHAGYAWLPVGLGLKALWLFTGVAWSANWLHALTMGAFGTMILAVMTRASLGHTGRPLIVSRTTAIAYVVLSLGVVMRVFATALDIDYRTAITASGALWTLAFALYLAAYTPILWRPRVDGRPG